MLEYSEGTKTLRLMPMNYMLANFEKGYWIVDTDNAIDDLLAIRLFVFFRHMKNKFNINSWKKFKI